jgi:hypothetical protein
MFQLNVVLYLVFDELMLIAKCPLQSIYFAFFVIKLAVDSLILYCIVLQFLFYLWILIWDFVDVRLNFQYLSIDLAEPALIVSDGLW